MNRSLTIRLNVTTEQRRAYIETFNQALELTAEQFLPQEHRSTLLHSSLLPARITGYVSTQFGVAIEYEPAPETTVQIVKGSARVEDLFVRAPPNSRAIGPLLKIGGIGSGVARMMLAGGFPFRLTTENASVSFFEVGFEIGPWRREVKFAEVFGNRDATNWSVGKAESRAKGEVLVAMVQLRKAQEKNTSLADYISRFKDKSVLLLGDCDADGLARLNAISQALESRGYDPVLVRDIPDHPQHDLSQKVVAIGAVSRFVVVDDSSAAGHLLEVQLCKQNNWVTVLLRAGGIGGSWMTAGASHASNVILELAYDPPSPQSAVSEAADW